MKTIKLSIFPRRSPRVYYLILVFTLLSILWAPSLFAQAPLLGKTPSICCKPLSPGLWPGDSR